MDLFEALSYLKASGSLVVNLGGRRYRLVVREGYIRLVIDETDSPFPLDRQEAMGVLRRIVKEASGSEVGVSLVEMPVTPPSKSILVAKEDLLLFA